MPEHPVKGHEKHIGCNFGKQEKDFNKVKRTQAYVQELNIKAAAKAHGKPSRTTTTTTSTSTTSTTTITPVYTTPCIYLAFEGSTVSNTEWNYAGPIVCAYSGLSEEEKQIIIDSVKADYSPWDVVVTTDEALFLSAPPTKRMRCIITESNSWYGSGAGGVSLIGSFTWGNDTPCFVFSKLLNYNELFIKEAISHEIGHTLDLYHQSVYDENCNLVKEYNSGGNQKAPIMGVSYYQPYGEWWVGPTTSCNTIQNDIVEISQILNLK